MTAAEDQLASMVVDAAGSGGGVLLRWATITSGPFFGGVQIQYASAPEEPDAPLLGGVPYLISSYPSAVVGDVVLVAIVDGAPIVLGKTSLSP